MRARALLGGGAFVLFAATQAPFVSRPQQDTGMACFGLAPPSACHAFSGLDQILRNPQWPGLGVPHPQSAKGVNHAAKHR